MHQPNKILTWALAFFVALLLLLIGLYPQLRLRQLRGDDYQNIYAYNDLDETAYAAYLQALIDNRPRRNNPYTGVDDAPDKPQPESLFSVQFFAPSMVAFAARACGADASAAMIWAGALAGFLTAFAMFWLALRLTENAWFASAATLVVLCGGVLAIGEGAISEMRFGWAAYPYFPFLRRYVPAVPFPFFWTLLLTVWLLLTSDKLITRIFYVILASLCFAALVYSYFYLWTTAAAWLACLALMWLVFRPLNWLKDWQAIAVLGGLAILSLAPYAVMLGNRDRVMDDVQLLVLTRMPDLLRAPEVISCASLALLSFGVWRKRFSPDDKRALFAASLALVPFAVFNQQIVTGRSLQPIHYQVFIVNYVALFALCAALFLVRRKRADKTESFGSKNFGKLIFPLIALAACGWGAVEAVYTTAPVSDANVIRDDARIVGERLRQLAQTELFDENGLRKTVLAINIVQGDDLPTVAPQAVLWARHGHVFTGETVAQNKLRFYHYLHFAGADETILSSNLRSGEVITTIALFGWDRLTGRLSSAARPLTELEIRREADNFLMFRQNFDRAEAARLPLSYLVIDADANFDFNEIDRWYERGASEKFGKYLLFRLKLRN